MTTFIAVGQSTASLVSNRERKEVRVPVYVDARGYIQNADIVHQPITALEKGTIDGPRAVILHRTDSTTTAGTLLSFQRGVGTHFLVGKDGTIHQTASLLKKTHHVGKIRSRCQDEASCPADEIRMLSGWGFAPSRIHDHEKRKPYPVRYPMNEDSVGIETVALFHRSTQVWDAPTPEQAAAIDRLIDILKREYTLSDSDIHEHDRISYKTPGEGAGLYDGTDRVPASQPPPRP